MRKFFWFLSVIGSLIAFMALDPMLSVKALSFAAQINKSFTPISIVAGQTSRLDIHIYNPNLFQLDNASFTDSLVGVQPGLVIATPANLSNTCGGIVLASAGTTTISLSGGTVPAQVGSTPGSCVISVDVTSTTPGNLINTIPAYGVLPAYGGEGLYATARGGLDIITNTDPASATLQVGGVQPPSMNKNFSPTTVWVGQSTQLEINVFNNDPNNALTQATYTDTLPVPFVVASPLTVSLSGCGAGTLTASVGAASVTLNNATISSNSNCRVRVQVVSFTQGQYTNTIPAGPSGAGSLHTQQGVTNASPVTANVNVQAVGITKAFTPTTFSQGDISTLTITLRNPTGADYVGVGLVDTLPAGLTISGTPAAFQCGGAITSSANSLTLTGGVIPAGNVTTPGLCTIVAQATSSTPGTYINTIPANTMTGPITNAYPASATATVQARTIGVVKAFGANFVVGQTASLTITLQNRTSTAFTGVAFTDTMPAGLNIVGTPSASPSCGGGAAITSTASSFSLSNAIIPAGTSAVPGTCVITATVTALAGGSYQNTIPANGVSSAQGIGNNTSSSSSVTVYTIGASATVSKAFQTSPILAGSPTRLRITITAPNDTPLSSIFIRNSLPDDLVIVGSPSPLPTTTCGGVLTAGIGTQLIQLSGGAIANPGGNCTITVYVTSNLPGAHINTIPGNTLITLEGRTDANNRSATLTVTNLTMSKLFTPSIISPTGLSRLTISLTNSNLLPLTTVSLSDALTTMGGNASNGVFIAPTPNGSTTCGGGVVTANPGTQTISLSGGTIPASDGIVPGLCTVSVDVQGIGSAATRTNTLRAVDVIGTIQGTSTTMRPAADVTSQLTITPLSIQVVKGFMPLTVFGGSSSVMSIQLVNPNTAPLTGINFSDTMPVGMVLANPVAEDVGTCGGTLSGAVGTQTFTYTGGSLPASGTCTLTLNVTMTVIGNLTNTISTGAVKTFEGASNPQPASASLTNLPGASISKFFSPNPIYVGEYSLLTITIQNLSNVALSGMGMNDDLPGVLPSGLEIAGSPAPLAENNCGGVLTAAPGSQTIQLVGGTLAGNTACTIVVPVTSTVPNSYLNTIPASNLTNDQDSTNQEPAIDTLVVTSFSLGNRVWDDNGAGGGTANDGIRNGAEAGMDGVLVNLYQNGSVIATDTTAGGGYYRFDALPAGDYLVEIAPPSGYISSTVKAANPNNDVDNDNNGSVPTGANLRSGTVTLGPGAIEPGGETDPLTNPLPGEAPDPQSNRTVDFGLFRPYSLGNRIWDDNGAGGGTANNGIREGGEPGLAGVTVRLYRDSNLDGNPDGAFIAFTVSDASGYYHFDNLVTGSYLVEVVAPTGYTSSAVRVADPNTDVDEDNNGAVAVGSNFRSGTITLGPGAGEPTGEGDPATNPLVGEAPDDQSNRTVDFGFTTSYSLGNRAWDDNGAGGGTANDGLRNGSEPGIDGLTINLYRGGTLVASTATAGGGYYRFDGLPTGDYTVEAAIPGGYSSSSVNEADPNLDIDDDNNGVTIVGGFIRSGTVTLGPGPAEPITDNDPATNPQAGEAANNSSNRTLDFGFYHPPYSLGNRVWDDNGAGGGTANNGVRDGTEPGMSGVTVWLYLDANTNGTPDGPAIAVTTTDGSGYYRFDFLAEGSYLVDSAVPSGYTASAVRVADPDTDIDDDNNGAVVAGSHMRSGTVTLGPAGSEPTNDDDPLPNPQAGEAPNDQSNRTVDFSFTPLAAIGDVVWYDSNHDGIQDASEPGIPGVSVALYTGVGALVTTTTSGGGGSYHFSGLVPGDYYLVFTAPSGYTISPLNAGGNLALDNDADPSNGRTATTTLSSGENDLTWDAGMYQVLASLGDFVWSDLNLDGIQDAGEPGIDGVTIQLYRPGFGPDGIPNTPDDTAVVSTTVTAGGGLYNFNNLTPGNYYIVFVPPPAYAISPINQGGNPATNSDANPATGQTATTSLIAGENDLTWDAGMYQLASLGDLVWDDLNRNGIQDVGEAGIAGVTVQLFTGPGTLLATTSTVAGGFYHFTNLVPGDYYLIFSIPGAYAISPIHQGGDPALDSDADPLSGQTATTNLASGENDLTWDAGIYQLASLGDFVWDDLNRDGIQDAGEPGMDGVTVTLFGGGGTLVAATTTAGGGRYLFEGLVPGDYYLTFTLPADHAFSPLNQGGNPAADSDANVADGQTVTTTLDPGENDLTWDAGIYLLPAALGDTVWLDLNADGIQNNGEPGVAGVTVSLYDSSGGLLETTLTDSSGLYHFTNLTPDYYSVGFSLPAGYLFTLIHQGGDSSLDSDALIPSGRTNLFQLTPGQNDLSWDAGLYQVASLGDFVWSDINANGIQDTGEAGIPNVTVNLYDSGGSLLTATTTDSGGLYQFIDLTPGSYSVGFVAPTGSVFSPANQGADSDLDSDADTATGRTVSTTLVSGENDPSWDAGLYQVASLGDFVWSDSNANGIQDAGEPGIPNVMVNLYDNGGALLTATTTDSGGLYQFMDLTPGSYSVGFVAPTGSIFSPANQGADSDLDSDADTTTGRTVSTTLVSGENDLSWDAGLYQLASLGDFVWSDSNANGIQDAGELGIPNVTVNLYDSGGALLASTTTDGGGLYQFVDLTPGSYSLGFVAPTGSIFSPANQGADSSLDSDADPATGRTVSTTLVSGENDLSWDAGLYQLASLGDFVWSDSNANGIQDAGEAGIPNVTVNLYDSGGALLASTTTDGGGLYQFIDLTPGSYSLGFVAPTGSIFSPANQGADSSLDSDADTTTGRTVSTTLVSGENDLSWDAGLYQVTALGDFVWSDSNANGIQDAGELGIPNVTVNLYDSGGALLASTTTDGGGLYQFIDLTPGSYSVGFVAPTGSLFSPANQGADTSLDSDADITTGRTVSTTLVSGENDLSWDAGLYQLASLGDFVWLDANGNGMQEAGETGVSGVTVSLTDMGGQTLATRITDAGGNYLFDNLVPGNYRVVFTPPPGFALTLRNQGSNSAVDSDPDRVSGQTALITLVSGQIDLDWDAGLYQPASLGNFVWYDANNNGIQDAGENGVDGVTVSLYDGASGLITTTTTAGGGLYQFSGLIPGDYSVTFILPPEYVFSPLNQGGDAALDSDADVATGQTTTITLITGQTDLTWDAGLSLVAKIGLAKRVVGAPVLVSPGVWDVTFEFLVKNYSNATLHHIQVVDDLASTFPSTTSAAYPSPTTFTVQSLASASFTVNWPGYDGATDTKLLAGVDADALNPGAEGKITLVVRVVPSHAGPFLNTATTSGITPTGASVTDVSQDGADPNPDPNDGDPTNNSDPTPVGFGARLYNPPVGVKDLEVKDYPLFHWSMTWANTRNLVAIHAAVSDGIPIGTTYYSNGISSGFPLPTGTLPAQSTTNGVSCTHSSTITFTQYCYYEGPTAAYPRGRIVWQGILGPDFDVKDVTTAINSIVIKFDVRADLGIKTVSNIATIDADMNGNGTTTDGGEVSVASASKSWTMPTELPETGFAPGMVTSLPAQPAGLQYTVQSGLSLEIPAIRVQTQIVGVPLVPNGWDITWLGSSVGYLVGTAYPTLDGNSVVTGHVYDANGLPGPFVDLHKLKWGDQIVVLAFGQRYTYEVRQVYESGAVDSTIFSHENRPWITLVTCKDYDQTSGTYQHRVVVKAVLVKIE